MIEIRSDCNPDLVRFPDSIAIALTMRCNLTCEMCSFWKKQYEDLPFDRVIAILDEAHALGIKRFDPWGTELFMRGDMPEILEYAERIGFQEIYVVSNGILLNRPELLDKLAKLKSLVLIVSLDGPQAVHDELRGRGVFDQAVSALRELGQRDIKRSIASIIMRPTLDHLHQIIDLASDLHIPVISMQPYCRDLAGPSSYHEKFEFRADEKQRVAKKMKDLLKYARQKKIIIYTKNIIKHVSSYLTEGVNPFPPKGCSFPSKTLVVDIEGNTYPCFAIHKNMGNVNGMSLSAIWYSKSHEDFIISAFEKRCPGCLMACSDVAGYNIGLKTMFHQSVDPRQWMLYIKRKFNC